MTKVISSREIAQQLSSLSSHLNGLELEATELALAAVSGNTDAAMRLAEIRKEIERAKGDRDILESAKAAAMAKEVEAEDNNDEAERAAALAEAQTHAGELVKLADDADALIDQFKTLIAKIDVAERAAHLAVRRSGIHNPGSVGSNSLGEHVLSRLDLHVMGSRLFDKRSVAQIASAGWRFILELETDEAA
ncbi:hypothetical protein BCH_00232 [Brucella sp. 191011898]|nr:hypothetical protein BCH_00232 [Brucella sp. 191011898]